MDIKKENVLAAYETARKAGADSTMKVLEQLFGEETFKPKDVMERIKTFEDACQELGEDHPFVQAYQQLLEIATREDYMSENFGYDMLAYLKLRIICAALNEGWEPQFTENEWRYYPWFYLYTQSEIDEMNEEKKRRCVLRSGNSSNASSGLAYASASSASSSSSSNVVARLAFKSEELAAYAGRQFAEIYADFYFRPDAKAGSAEM